MYMDSDFLVVYMLYIHYTHSNIYKTQDEHIGHCPSWRREKMARKLVHLHSWLFPTLFNSSLPNTD